MAVQVRYNSWYISLPSSAKQLNMKDQILRCLENMNHEG